MAFEHILFDLDGTLTDSYEGIAKCVQYALHYYGIEENNEEKDKGKNGISAVADRIFDFLVMAGQYFCHIIADVFSKPAVYVAYAAVFIWKHTALFRDAVKRTFCEIGSFFFAPLLKSKRVLQRTNRQIRTCLLYTSDAADE